MVAFPGTVVAQTIRGSVTDEAGMAVPGVVVSLLDRTGAASRSVMTDSTGAFAVIAPGTGSYRVRATRIGFRPVTTDAITVVPGLNAAPAIRLAGLPITLDTVRIASRSSCDASRDPGFATIWDQARTALTAAQLTAASRGLTATVLTYERTLDPQTRRVREQNASEATGFVTQPWRAVSPAILHREGYVATDDSGWVVYRAPGLAALMSDAFVQDHCFEVKRSRDGEVAVEFAPTRERREIPEINGTIWLDAHSAELRRMEYRYVNVPSEQENEAGGTMTFARLRDGGWAIARWSIRMPTLEQTIINGRPVVRARDILETGGDLTLALRGADTLWTRQAVALAGTVVDSASGAALRGARLLLEGTTAQTVTGEDGGFRLHDIVPGEYTLAIRTAPLDAVGAAWQLPIMVTGSASDLRIRVGKPRPRLATFVGVVMMDSTQRPLPDAHVAFPELARATYTDSAGAFRLEGLPPGEHQLVVRRVGYGPLDTRVALAPARTTDRRIVLQAVPTLDTVSVVATSVIPSFDEHRAQRLGQFITREQLEKQSGRRLSEVLQELRGVRITNALGRLLLTTRRRNTADYRLDEEGRLHQHEGFCASLIWLDGSLIYGGGRGEQPPEINRLMTPDQIEAIEYYETQAQVPMRYARGNTNCGVLVIHTRRVRR